MTDPLPHSVAPRGQDGKRHAANCNISEKLSDVCSCGAADLPTTYADLVKLLDDLTEQFPEFRETLSGTADVVDAHERRTKRITQSVGE